MEDDDVQMHHTAIQLRQMMPQADFRIALGLMMADMEEAAKNGEGSITFVNGAHGVDDMADWVGGDGHVTGRAARIAAELDRLGYSVRYGVHEATPSTLAADFTYKMIVKW